MALKIGIQAGHYGRTSGSTGAPGEQELTGRIWKNLSQQLIEKGFQVYMFGADPPIDNTLQQDFHLFLSLHGDADIYGTGGGFADYPEPSTDGATKESQRICKVINDNYFPETGIKYVNRSNRNTRYYYMWKYLSAKTPCVLIEMGVVQDAHDKVLLANTTLIVNALGRAICKAFGVSYEAPTPELPPVDPCKDKLEALEKEIVRLKKELSDQGKAFDTKMASKDIECQNYRVSDKIQFKTDLKKWADAY